MCDTLQTANDLCLQLLPTTWYEDRHDSQIQPRCCQAIACIQRTLEAVPEWTEEDARDLAREVVRGMKGLARA